MNDKQIYLIFGLVISTIILSMGINSVDSTITSMVTRNPELIEGTGETLFFKTTLSFQYHLGIVLVFAGYIAAIGTIFWYFQKKFAK